MRVATLRGNVDVASCLISCGADVDMKDDSHQTVLMVNFLLSKLILSLFDNFKSKRFVSPQVYIV